jgi:hypothetical protein
MMRLILLAGYKASDPKTCPWLQFDGQELLLESRIKEALLLTAKVYVVMSGEGAEYALQHCPSLEKCEFIFDTNDDQASLLTNLRAALHHGFDPAIVHPAELPLGPKSAIKALVGWAAQQGAAAPFHFLQLPAQGFPLVITPNGAKKIYSTRELKGLADEQLQFGRMTPLA